jgi:tetratricopeptide (TPR) repeat protein
MKKLLSIILLLSFASLGFSVTLFGKVYNESTLEAIPNAKLETHGIKTQTDSKGYYYFRNFDYGILILEVRAKGYIPYTTTISLDDKKVRLDIPLKQTLPVVTPEMVRNHDNNNDELKIPEVKTPVAPKVPTVSRPSVHNQKNTKKSVSELNPLKINIAKPKTKPSNNVDIAQKSYSIDFIHAKKMLENGDFMDALPLFYGVSQNGEKELAMQSDYYISIIYRTQKLYSLEIDYLIKTISKAFENREKLAFINQARTDLANAYFKFGHSATAKILAQRVLKDQAKNFPLTNFNCLSLMAELKKNDGKLEQAYKYYESALKLSVKPQLKNTVYLKVIDFHIQREEFNKAKSLLAKLSNSFQSSQTEKRRILLSALESYQSYLQSGDTSDISKKIIPQINKCLKIDPDFVLALSYLANIEFLVGKLENNLQLVMDSKKIAERLDILKVPFSVNTAAQMAAISALKDDDHINFSVKHNSKWKNILKCSF